MASHLIKDEWVSSSGEPFASENPATGDTLWTGTEATKDTISQAVESAAQAFPSWSSLSVEKRFSFLETFGSALKAKASTIAEIISMETGKPFWESQEEVASILRKIPLSKEAYHERCPGFHKSLDHTSLKTHPKPHGVVAVLGPFNFPGHLPHGHIIPALLAGNTVVFKPSELTPLTGEALMRCWNAPPGVLNLVQGKASTGHYLANHPQLNGLFFTGSFSTGMHLAELFSRHPEKILALEMGGNNPLVFADTPNIKAAALLTLLSSFLTAGQRCSCARRLIIVDGEESEAYLKAVVQLAQSLQVGPYTNQPQPFMGPVMTKEKKEGLLAAQATLGASGGHPLLEMRSLVEKTPFLSPGIMDVTGVAHRPDEELFGPFLQVLRVKTIEEAILEANRTQFGLTAGIICREKRLFHRFWHETKAGVINWNTPLTGASSRAPFGGVKRSGNFRPSAFYAADYCSYPVASMENPAMAFPKTIPPGITLP